LKTEVFWLETDEIRRKQSRFREYDWRKLQNAFFQFDLLFIRLLHEWATLVAASLGVFLCAWGIAIGDYNLLIEVLVTGAVAYSIGFVPALAGDLIIVLIRIFDSSNHHAIATELLQFLGCAYIAWLGFQHRQLVRANREQLQANKSEHPSHVIPWSLVNEVRNSLLAIRLLLFQQSSKHADSTVNKDEMKLMEDELLRLELIFGSLSKHEEPKKKQSGT
jgi:hypothetical protein